MARSALEQIIGGEMTLAFAYAEPQGRYDVAHVVTQARPRAGGYVLVPELYVSNLERSLSFYCGLLGFAVEYDRPEERFASIALGAARILLEQTDSLSAATPEQFQQGQWRLAELEFPFGRGLNLELPVTDLQPLRERLAAANYPLLLDAHERSYRIGTRRLTVQRLLVADPDGYLIRPSQVLHWQGS